MTSEMTWSPVPVFTVMGVLWAMVSACTAAALITRRDVVVQWEPGVCGAAGGSLSAGRGSGP